jgi:kynureninase
LNSGPGGIAGAFVHQKHHNNMQLKRLGTGGGGVGCRAISLGIQTGGWWGHNWATRFDMNQPWDPIGDAYGFRLSNPPILQIASHLASVDIFDRATMPALRAKSELLTGG